MTIFATNGTRIFVGPVIEVSDEDLVAADFTALTYTIIGETSSIGSFGDTANEVTFASLTNGRQRRLKGTRDAGTLELTCGLDATDAGQLALKAGEKTTENYAFKVEFPSGAVRYFGAMIGSAVENVSEVDNVLSLTTTLWVNSNIVAVEA
jgi:Phage tail protein.